MPKKKKQNIMPTTFYIANINQSGQNAPTATVHENGIGFGNWVRVEAGFYTSTSTTLYDNNKLWAEGLSIGNTSNGVVPLHDYSAVVGYLNFGIDIDNGFVRYYIECFDVNNQYVDIADLMTNSNRIYLPEIRVYQ